jgi:DNA invertase Pin-like site-specific DNA recombinase
MPALRVSPEEFQRWEEHKSMCGKYGGKTILDKHPEKCREAVQLYKSGKSMNEICASIGTSHNTLYKILKIKGVRN